MSLSDKELIGNVLLVGGTHGNELTGIYLLKSWYEDKSEVERESFSTELLLANKKAIEIGKRYVDIDLNRNFLGKGGGDNFFNHEDKIAREICVKYGADGELSADFVVDIHTTTSQMGVTIMVEKSKVNLFVADKVRKLMPEAKIYCFEKSDRTQACLRSVAPYAIGLEVGPVGQNIYCHKTISQAKEAMIYILDSIDDINNGGLPEGPIQVDNVYYHVGSVAYPEPSLGEGFIVHESLEEKNYKPLLEGDFLFVGRDGSVIDYDGEEGLCPVFVNEAAYYDKNQAFSLVKKIDVTV